MIGHGPFLGQVPLARLGQQKQVVVVQLFRQDGPPIADHQVNVNYRTLDYSEAVSARTDSRGIAVIELEAPNIQSVRVTPEPKQGIVWDPPTIEKPFGGDNQFVFSATLVPKTEPPMIPGGPGPVPAAADSIPTWGYIVGGLAIAGLVAYAATR